MIRPASRLLRTITLLIGILFQLVPLPDGIDLARPYLLALFLSYWLLETPEHTGMGTAFVCGLLADIFSGGLLGEQAMRLVILAFMVSRFRARLRFFPLWQQSISILALLLNDRLIMTMLHLAIGDKTLSWVAWLSPIVGMIIWPWLFVGLDVLRMRARERK
jgi:rod shape-determining protein MreD